MILMLAVSYGPGGEGWFMLAFCPVATDDLDQIEGNEFRDVWKSSCWQMLDEVMTVSCSHPFLMLNIGAACI